jgi:Spy/CpxP family protein refolding chaperone
MIRLTMLAVSSVLALSTVPAHAETPGDVMKDIGRQMNGEPVHRDHYWREHERERAYRHEQHRLNDEQRELDARRRALHNDRRFNKENGFYGR